MHRITIHIWRQSSPGSLSLANLDHAVFQIQRLLNSPTAAGVNMTYTCPVVRLNWSGVAIDLNFSGTELASRLTAQGFS